MTIRKGDHFSHFRELGNTPMNESLIKNTGGDFIYDKYALIEGIKYQISLEFHKNILTGVIIYTDGNHFEQCFDIIGWESIQSKFDKNGQYYIELS